MPTGKIKFINLEKKFGNIVTEDGGKLHFKLKVVQKPTRWEELQEGMEVEFEVTQGEKGPTASWVALVGIEAKSAKTHPPAQKQVQVVSSAAPSTNNHRFLNPYNFVRWLPPQDDQASEPAAVRLMGHCPPPPHDRWVGLSGVIHCKAVAETPIFVADAEGVTSDADESKHKHYRFFKYGGKEAIPATSLRGPIRNIFEAATNSCFSNLENKRLSYHFSANDAPKLIPARLVPDANGWKVELLTGTTALREIGQIPNPQYAAWVQQYEPLEPSKTLLKDPPPNAKVRRLQERSRTNQKKVNLKSFKHGDDCYALLQDFPHPHPDIRFWDVLEISDNESELRKKIRDSRTQRVEHGWLCLTNQNIGVKHSERFFFRANDNNTGLFELPITDDQVLKDYVALIQDYQERHENEIKERRETRGSGHDHEPFETKKGKQPGFSRFIYQKEEATLRGNELVYVELQPNPHGLPIIKHLVPVSVPRVMFENSIQKLLPHERLRRCKNPNELCPACRTFGWVHGETGQEGAYAGRVRFSHAQVTEPIKEFEHEALLAILSSPKPTTTRFYLIHNSWRSMARSSREAGYDGAGNVLRGRKFYRHFGAKLDPKEYKRATDAEHNGKDEQNRTLHGILDKGSEFTFSVRFENIAPAELGALLWSLEMDGRGVHRIGLAKPLGFGSVRVKIDDSKGPGLQLFNAEARYAAATWRVPSNEMVLAAKRKQYVLAFKRAMLRRFASQRAQSIYEENDSGWDSAFEELHNIADLRAMLNDPPAKLAIHYPRMDPEPQAKGENFKWFMANNREAGRKQGLLLELEVPAEEVKNAKGLPLNPAKF